MRPPVSREVEDELAFHIEMTTRDLVAEGMSLENARAEAARRFGDVNHVNAVCQRLGQDRDRRARRAEMHVEFQQDLRFAARQLLRARGFTAVAILTLALGIGATTTVFSALYAVVLRPLAFPNPERAVVLTPTVKGQPNATSGAAFVMLQDRTDVFEHVAAALPQSAFTITDGDVPDIVSAGRVSASYFDVFAARPMLGRVFSTDEDVPGKNNVVVLSHREWTSRFGADPAVIGRKLHMNGQVFDIIGVMPPAFDITSNGDKLWVPLALNSEDRASTASFLFVVARLKAGVSTTQAQNAATLAYRGLLATLPLRRAAPAEYAIIVKQFVDDLSGDYRKLLYIIFGAVCFVLLIACTNVANLLLARATTRSKELAIRAALGAGRGRIVRQLLAESLLLASVGAVLGVGVAFVLLKVLLRLSPEDIPRLDQANIDWHVLLFALGMAMLSSIVFGLLPALRASGTQLQGTLREGGRGSAVSGRSRMRGLLVTAEVAIAVMLLAGSGLLLRSAWLVQRVNPGFEPHGVLTARVLLPQGRYESAESVVSAYERLQRETQNLNNAGAYALISSAPLTGWQTRSTVYTGPQSDVSGVQAQANFRLASTGYFATMRIPLRAGRDIAVTDNTQAPAVIVLNETLARQLFPNLPPDEIIGQRINAMPSTATEPFWREVIGIVGDIHDEALEKPAAPEFYLPFPQTPEKFWPFIQRSMMIVARTANDAADVEGLRAPLAKALAVVDPSLPLSETRPMMSYLRGSLATARFNTLLLSTLGGIALILAMVGVYGVVAHFVSQRTHEIGVRLALGATPASIWSLVLRRGLAPILTGIVIGVALSLISNGLLRQQLYGIAPFDPITLGAVGLLMTASAALATVVPARRAMRVSPLAAFSQLAG